MFSLGRMLVLGFALILLGGCAFGRGELNLDENSTDYQKNTVGQKIVIDSVNDQRNFILDASDPKVPSVNGDYIDSRESLIARKGNAVDKTLGDIVLANGQTVNGIVESVVKKSLNDAGFVVIANPLMADENTAHATVNIKNFWGWTDSDILVARINTNVNVDVVITAGDYSTTISSETKSTNKGMAAATRHWLNAFKINLDRMNQELKKKFSEAKNDIEFNLKLKSEADTLIQ
jgi:hypothetical protein